MNIVWSVAAGSDRGLTQLLHVELHWLDVGYLNASSTNSV